MKKYRKLLPPAVGLIYTGLRVLGVEVPITEIELLDAAISIGKILDLIMSVLVFVGVYGLKNES